MDDMRRATMLALLLGLGLLAQDAGLVLRTSVGYNTQKASLPLTEEQKKEADRLGMEAQTAGLSGKYGEALRLYFHGIAVMNKVEWTPAVELAASLQAKIDHALPEPGGRVLLTLSPFYATERDAGTRLAANVFLLKVNGDSAEPSTPIATAAMDPRHLPLAVDVKLPANATGNYVLETRLALAEGEWDPKARASYTKRVQIHIEALSAEAARLKKRLESQNGKSRGLATAEYALALYESSDKSEVNPHRTDFRAEFAAANAMLDTVAAGKDPFAGKTGDFHKAYRSDLDQSLQPYRLFVPSTYDGNKPFPLIVALHGMGGDENSMFDLYRSGQLKREAERLGFLVACPKGRDSASMYRGSAEKDVLDVLAEVKRDYQVDGERVFLMGHSMGGFGTWSIAMNHPELWAGLGPFSGGGNPGGMEKIKHIPEYVVHGDNDKTVPVIASRSMVAAGKKAGAAITYVEIPGGSHIDVVVPQLAPMLDFFAGLPKSRPAASNN